MKNKYNFIVFLIVALFMCCNATQAQDPWNWISPSWPQNILRDISFPDDNIGYAIGDIGTIIKTTDGGVTWFALESGTQSHLGSVSFSDADHGTAVGENGMILRTTNGGETWFQQSNGSTLHLYGVSFASNNVGMACSGYYDQILGDFIGVVFTTTDGGTTWTQFTDVRRDVLRAICMADENTAYACGEAAGTITKTTDCGRTWIPQNSGTNRELYDIQFSDKDHGIAVGSSSHCNVIMTTNGGETWVYNDDLPSVLDLKGVWFRDALNGTVVGISGTVLKTTDGGINWIDQTIPGLQGTIALYSVFFKDENIGIACASKGLIYRTTDGGTTWAPIFEAVITGACTDMKFFDEQNGIILAGSNYGSKIFKTTDRGATWVAGAQINGSRFSFLDINNGYAVGYNWTVYGSDINRTTDGGSTWTLKATVPTRYFNDICFADLNTGIAVGNYGKIYKTTDGGSTWMNRSVPDSVWDWTHFNKVFFLTANKAWTVGRNGIMYRTTDAGETWYEQATGHTASEAQLFNIYFLNSTTGWISGAGGILIKTTDAGETWNDINTGIIADLGGVCFYDINNGTIVGNFGSDERAKARIYRTTDGGNTWIDEWVRCPNGISNVCYTNANSRYVSGGGGTILTSVDFITPVELSFFTANVSGNNVSLSWTTATETNNQGFDIERKSGGSGFEKIGFVPGNGTTTELRTYSFTNNNVSTGTYLYRLKQIDYDGTYEYSNEITLNVITPNVYSLEQNYPNPFNPSTKINFNIASDSKVTLKLFNILGEEVITLLAKDMEAGSYSFDFSAKNLNSGVYFYTMEAKSIRGTNFISTKKMVLIK